MDEIKDEIIVGNPTETLLDEQNDVVNNIGTDADVCDIENDVENAQEVNKENEENVETAQSDEEEESVEERTSRTLSPGRIVLKRFFRSKLSITGLVMLIVLFVFSFIGPLFSNLPFIWGEREADDSKKVKETYYTEVSAPDSAKIPCISSLIPNRPTISNPQKTTCSARTTRDSMCSRVLCTAAECRLRWALSLSFSKR